MSSAAASHRQTVTLSASTARRVKALARTKGVSTSRLLAHLVEQGLDSEQQKRGRFMELAGQFRAASDPKDVEKLGHQLGQMVFGR